MAKWRLPRRQPGQALRDLQRDHGGGPDPQDAQDHLKRLEAAERMRFPWRGRREGWRKGGRSRG